MAEEQEMAPGPKGEVGNPADRFYTGGAPIDPDRQPPLAELTLRELRYVEEQSYGCNF